MTDGHLTREEIETFAAEMYAAEQACAGALPLTPEDEAALDRIRIVVLAAAAKPDQSWWQRAWRRLTGGGPA